MDILVIDFLLTRRRMVHAYAYSKRFYVVTLVFYDLPGFTGYQNAERMNDVNNK